MRYTDAEGGVPDPSDIPDPDGDGDISADDVIEHGLPSVSERYTPADYQADYAEQARKMCALGATDAELADFFRVDVRTIQLWIASQDDFAAAVQDGVAAADERVQRSLYLRAIGYSYERTKIIRCRGRPVTLKWREHVPPDTDAAKYWLSNRRGGQWRNKQELSGGDEPLTVRIIQFSELDALPARATAELTTATE